MAFHSPGGLSLTPQVLSSHTSLPRRSQRHLGFPSPRASSSGHRGCYRNHLTHTSKNQDPRQAGGPGRAGRTLACMPALSTRAPSTGWGKLPPGLSQLWLMIGGHHCRPSCSSLARQWRPGGSAAQGHCVHHLLQLAPEPLPSSLLILLQSCQDLWRPVGELAGLAEATTHVGPVH